MINRCLPLYLTVLALLVTLLFAGFIVDSENKFTFFEIYVRVYDYGIFNRFTQTRA